MCQFLKEENVPLHELETEQFRKILRASLAVHTGSLKDDENIKRFLHFFREMKFSFTFLNGLWSLQWVLEISQAKAPIFYKMSLPTLFEEYPSVIYPGYRQLKSKTYWT